MGEVVVNPYPGLRASAELVALVDALAELADDAGHHVLARHAGRVAAQFTDQVLSPPARERQLARRTALNLLRPALHPDHDAPMCVRKQGGTSRGGRG